MQMLRTCGAASRFVVIFSTLSIATTACAAESVDKPQWPQGLECRKPEWRKQLLARGGGTEASEKAVAAALKWLAEHQALHGGWSFDLKAAPKCQGACSASGHIEDADFAATGLTLLAFLGAGHTTENGDYQEPVRAGVKYLVDRLKIDDNGGALMDRGNMYSHGIAAQALVEAYATTADEKLKKPAEAALGFIVYAQDPVRGGWRYQPRQPGDTSVFGWQMAAIKAGKYAGLAVPEQTLAKAGEYLDTVQSTETGLCGYVSGAQPRPTMTAVGLLGRLQLGRLPTDPMIPPAVATVAEAGPASGDFYFHYYATQLLYAVGGEPWKKWNEDERTGLVQEQVTTGHAAGSWDTDKKYGGAGGRLYATALATLILEVYYRYPPAGVKDK